MKAELLKSFTLPSKSGRYLCRYASLGQDCQVTVLLPKGKVCKVVSKQSISTARYQAAKSAYLKSTNIAKQETVEHNDYYPSYSNKK